MEQEFKSSSWQQNEPTICFIPIPMLVKSEWWQKGGHASPICSRWAKVRINKAQKCFFEM
jgi:hypothetical protein